MIEISHSALIKLIHILISSRLQMISRLSSVLVLSLNAEEVLNALFIVENKLPKLSQLFKQ